jgi:2-O-(6-phospho-alpha-D-mannosyl)-D-glycerate hydrolase
MTTLAGREHVALYLLAHTHWDREWYLPSAQFKQRLVALIDELLDASDATPFLLDGQAVVLEDYLEIRPERASDLSARLRNGSLEAGPWYVLPDELIPSGEALVRNLLFGRRVLSRLRASSPPVLYCPDSFGHPAALATLAQGFGYPVTVVWRGYGGRRWPAGDTVRLRAPDGSTVLLYHLSASGYELGSNLPPEDAGARTHGARLHSILAPRSTLGAVLLPLGADHHAPQPRYGEAIDALRRALPDDALVRASLTQFAERIGELAAARALPTVEGELRDSYGYAWTLAGTLGGRAALKRRNAIVERALTRDAEPWAALARFRDGRSRRPVLNSAWRSVLLSHPHDTLCGCAVDEVARAMDGRLDDAMAAAAGIRDEALEALLGYDAASARSRMDEWSPVVVLRNRSAHRRTGVAEIDLDVVVAEVPVGPGSGETPVASPAGAASSLVTLGSPASAMQVIGRRRLFAREESPRHYPRNRLVERRRAVAWVDAVPAFGLRILDIRRGLRRRPRPPEVVRASGQEMDNGRLRIVADAGGVSLHLPEGPPMPEFLRFEAQGEHGDLYTHSTGDDAAVPARLVRARLLSKGPLRAELATLWELDVPHRRTTSATGKTRHAPRVRLPVRATLQLDAGAPFVRILVTGDNRATDVRIRACLVTRIVGPTVFADAAFGPVERRSLAVTPDDAAMEQPPATAPLQRYVSLFDSTRGCTVYSDGLAEYEAAADGTLFVTLLRAVGELSRADLPERPGHAGWPVETPGAQSLGTFRAMLALLPHGPRRPGLASQVEHVADDVLLPLTGHTWRTAIAPPDFVEGVQLVGRGLACSAVKESEDGEWTVLRCVNLLDDAVTGAWRLPGMHEAQLARLDETPLGARTVRNAVVTFEAPPRAVVTLLVR